MKYEFLEKITDEKGHFKRSFVNRTMKKERKNSLYSHVKVIRRSLIEHLVTSGNVKSEAIELMTQEITATKSFQLSN